MVKASVSDKTPLRKGAWSAEEDRKLINYINRYGIWNWTLMPKPAGLLRSGKSCRLRWMNYLRPDIKRGNFSQEEDRIIIELHEKLGNRWCKIAAKLPGRTDNEIKNRWHTRLKKRLKNNPEPSSSLKRRENAIIEANQNDPPDIDPLPYNSPKVLNLDDYNWPPSPYTDQGVAFAYPEFVVLTSQLELLEDTSTYYDGGFDLWV